MFTFSSASIYLWITHTTHSLKPPLHGNSTDVSPPAIEAACGLLDGFTLGLCGTGVTVVQQHLIQVQHWRHTCAVLLNVTLQILHRDSRLLLSFSRHQTFWSSWLFLFNFSLLGKLAFRTFRGACGHEFLYKCVSSCCIISSKNVCLILLLYNNNLSLMQKEADMCWLLLGKVRTHCDTETVSGSVTEPDEVKYLFWLFTRALWITF